MLRRPAPDRVLTCLLLLASFAAAVWAPVHALEVRGIHALHAPSLPCNRAAVLEDTLPCDDAGFICSTNCDLVACAASALSIRADGASGGQWERESW